MIIINKNYVMKNIDSYLIEYFVVAYGTNYFDEELVFRGFKFYLYFIDIEIFGFIFEVYLECVVIGFI